MPYTFIVAIAFLTVTLLLDVFFHVSSYCIVVIPRTSLRCYTLLLRTLPCHLAGATGVQLLRAASYNVMAQIPGHSLNKHGPNLLPNRPKWKEVFSTSHTMTSGPTKHAQNNLVAAQTKMERSMLDMAYDDIRTTIWVNERNAVIYVRDMKWHIKGDR